VLFDSQALTLTLFCWKSKGSPNGRKHVSTGNPLAI